jgi:hypothetical protein
LYSNFFYLSIANYWLGWKNAGRNEFDKNFVFIKRNIF